MSSPGSLDFSDSYEFILEEEGLYEQRPYSLMDLQLAAEKFARLFTEQILQWPGKHKTIHDDESEGLRKQLHCLGYSDNKIDSFCDGLNPILVETQKLLALKFILEALLLLAARKLLALVWFLEALLNLVTLAITVCFSEFPNNLRPPCTTMPWIIVPALFVLWGVCWMFINQASPSLSDIAEAWQNAILSVEHDSFPIENLDDTNWEYFDNFRDVSSSGEISHNHQSHFSLVGVPLPSEVQTSVHQTSFPWNEPSNLVQVTSFEPPWQSASNETGFLARHGQPDVLASTSSGVTKGIAELGGNTQALLVPSSKDLLSSTSRNSAVLSGYDEGENIAVDEASQKVVPATGIENRLNIAEKREFRCDHVGCEELTFSYESQLKRHLDRHSRPFTCVECSESFGAKKDLQRHLDTKHQKEVQVFCTVAGCKRGNLGFSRRDNLLKHIHNVHERGDQAKGLTKLVSPNEDAVNETKITKKRKRESHDLEELSREQLIESLLKEQSKNERLLEEMGQQRVKLEEDLRVQRERYEKNEDRLWRMIEERRQ